MTNVKTLTKRIIEFRDAREWKKFHQPKDVAIALVLEAAEVIEHFQWKSEQETKKYLRTNRESVAEELADVLYCVLLMSRDLGIDILDALDRKMDQNEKKYPVEKAKGNAKKYTEFQETF